MIVNRRYSVTIPDVVRINLRATVEALQTLKLKFYIRYYFDCSAVIEKYKFKNCSQPINTVKDSKFHKTVIFRQICRQTMQNCTVAKTIII